ncbi:MAG: Era-like GTP-binding protein [Candidatus Woesearchaeota archaeon]
MVFSWFKNLFSLFKKKKEIKLGLYGPPNSGKTTLANKICKDWLGEELGSVSHIAHETREIKIKEKVVIKRGKKTITFDIIDTPGIATRIDYEDFLKEGLSEEESKERAREATKGVIEAIKWLDNVEAVIVVLDSTQDPYTQVNITILGNLAARKIPVIIAANKIDLPKADLDRITNAFPQYPVIGISAKEGTNVDLLYDKLFEILK